MSGKYLDVMHQHYWNDGPYVQQYSWNGQDQQIWLLSPAPPGGNVFYIKNLKSQKVLDACVNCG